MRVLIISEYFAPTSSIASVRWTKLAKYLARDLGYEVDVLTNEKDYTGRSLTVRRYDLDESLRPDLAYVKNVYTIRMPLSGRATCLVMSGFRGLKHFAQFVRDVIPRRYTSGSGNSRTATPLGTTGVSARLQGQMLSCLDDIYGGAPLPDGLDISCYDVIISSFGPKWPHYYARHVKRKQENIIWLADYRDSLVNLAGLDYGANSEENKTFAMRITGSADAILGVAQECLDDLYLYPSMRTYVVPNGFDTNVVEERGAGCQDSTFAKEGNISAAAPRFELVYTGTLYSSGEMRQDLSGIYASLERLAAAGRVDPARVRVTYAGATEELFLGFARAHPSIVSRSLGLVSRREAIELQQHAACLVFLAWNTRGFQGVVTGKIFEYLSAGTPIVGYVSGDTPGAIATEMIARSRTGICAEEARGEGDLAKLDDFIAEKYEEWERTATTTIDPDWNYINTFSYANRAKQVDQIIRELLEDRKGTDAYE